MRVCWTLAAAALCLAALLGGERLEGARAGIVERGNLSVSFQGELTPRALPRQRLAPVAVQISGTIRTDDGAAPPQLQRISIAVNRSGRFALDGLPRCRIEQIQPSTTSGALEACGGSLVGEGSFSANVLLPEQAPFPSHGDVRAFNGSVGGRPAILAHVYGTDPVPTSYTLPLFVAERGRGPFGTVLSGSLPQVTSEWGHVTGISLRLDRTFRRGGARQGFVSARCSAAAGFPGAVFPLARTTFAFEGGIKLTDSLVRRCRVRGG